MTKYFFISWNHHGDVILFITNIVWAEAVTSQWHSLDVTAGINTITDGTWWQMICLSQYWINVEHSWVICYWIQCLYLFQPFHKCPNPYHSSNSTRNDRQGLQINNLWWMSKLKAYFCINLMQIIQLTKTLYEKELKILRYPTKLGQKDIQKCRNQRHVIASLM